MDAGCVIAAGSCHGFVAGLVERLDLVEIEGAAERFIEELYGRDDVSVPGVAFSEILKRGECLANAITLLPSNSSVTAAIVETIL